MKRILAWTAGLTIAVAAGFVAIRLVQYAIAVYLLEAFGF